MDRANSKTLNPRRISILNKALLIIACLICCALHGNCQGQFLFYNGSARTRIGSIDGPLAGRGFWAQMLVGDNLSSLAPVGVPLEHTTNGAVGGIVRVTVPDVPPDTFAYVQMVAWNGIAWGTDLSGVPLEQLGRTDIVQVELTSGVFPDIVIAPHFFQAAVVPIPEPSVWALGILGALVHLPLLRRCCHPYSTTTRKNRAGPVAVISKKTRPLVLG